MVYNMTKERYKELTSNEDAKLTEQEFAEGWHFCNEFDGALVKGDPKEEYCGQACINWMCNSYQDKVTIVPTEATKDI